MKDAINTDTNGFSLRETDIVKDGNVYCKVCGERVKGNEYRLFGHSIHQRINCACERKRMETEREQRKLMEIEMLVEDCFTTRELLRCKLEDFKESTSRAYVVAKNFVENFETLYKDNVGLLFYGNVGTGKTYLAAAIANEIIQRYLTKVKMRNLTQIIQELQTSKFNEDRNQMISRLCNVPLLILDDLGIERDTSYAREQIYNIINERYVRKKPTIFTTNVPIAEFQKAQIPLDYERIYSRIMEMTIPIKVVGEDIRRQIQKEKLEKYKGLLLGGETP